MGGWFSLPALFSSGRGWESGWLPLIAILTAAVSLFYSFLYIIGYVFNLQLLKRLALYEIFQAFATFLLAVFLVTILNSAFTWALNLVGGSSQITCDAYGKITLSGAGPIEAVRCDLMSKGMKLADLYEQMYVSARKPFADFYRSFSIMGIPIYYYGSFIYNYNPSALYQIIENYRYLNDVLTHYLIGINGYLVAVNYIQNNMLSMFLPIGVVLRAFPWTRGIGAFFIALAIVLYFIFPIIFFVTDPTFKYIQPSSSSLGPRLIDNPATQCWKTFSGVAATASLSSVASSGATAAYTRMSLSKAMNDVTKLYLGLVLHPLLAFGISLIFIKYLADVLGGESQEILRFATKLI